MTQDRIVEKLKKIHAMYSSKELLDIVGRLGSKPEHLDTSRVEHAQEG